MAAEPTTSSRHAERHFVLAGYTGNRTSGTAKVVILDRARRARRAAKGIAVLWGAALLSVLVPVAHFILVPGFAVAGLMVLWGRLRAREQIEAVHGVCPDCGIKQSFDLPVTWSPPVSLSCGSCGRTLTAS